MRRRRVAWSCRSSCLSWYCFTFTWQAFNGKEGHLECLLCFINDVRDPPFDISWCRQVGTTDTQTMSRGLLLPLAFFLPSAIIIFCRRFYDHHHVLLLINGPDSVGREVQINPCTSPLSEFLPSVSYLLVIVCATSNGTLVCSRFLSSSNFFQADRRKEIFRSLFSSIPLPILLYSPDTVHMFSISICRTRNLQLFRTHPVHRYHLLFSCFSAQPFSMTKPFLFMLYNRTSQAVLLPYIPKCFCEKAHLVAPKRFITSPIGRMEGKKTGRACSSRKTRICSPM